MDSEILDTVSRVAEDEEAVVRNIPAWLLSCGEGGEWAGVDGLAFLVEPDRLEEIGAILFDLAGRLELSADVYHERWAELGRVGVVLRYCEGEKP